MANAFFHLLNLNKPSGVTSRRVVDQIQRLIRPAKTGHAGTLDPLASGVLVVSLGQATRLIEYVQRMRKQYTGTFLLGRSSPTEDIEGNVVELANPPRPDLAQIIAAAGRLTGEIMQRPPAFSALKVGGRRAYDLARRGEDVQLEPRPITIHRLDVVRYDYPELVLDIECSSGTYVRSLGRDLAESLGTAAVMSALVRTAIGEFRLEDACNADDLTRENLAQYLLPGVRAVADLPVVQITGDEQKALAAGLFIELSETRLSPAHAEAAALDAQGQVVALIGPTAGRWRPLRNFAIL